MGRGAAIRCLPLKEGKRGGRIERLENRKNEVFQRSNDVLQKDEERYGLVLVSIC